MAREQTIKIDQSKAWPGMRLPGEFKWRAGLRWSCCGGSGGCVVAAGLRRRLLPPPGRRVDARATGHPRRRGCPLRVSCLSEICLGASFVGGRTRRSLGVSVRVYCVKKIIFLNFGDGIVWMFGKGQLKVRVVE